MCNQIQVVFWVSLNVLHQQVQDNLPKSYSIDSENAVHAINTALECFCEWVLFLKYLNRICKRFNRDKTNCWECNAQLVAFNKHVDFIRTIAINK